MNWQFLKSLLFTSRTHFYVSLEENTQFKKRKRHGFCKQSDVHVLEGGKEELAKYSVLIDGHYLPNYLISTGGIGLAI